MQASVAATAQAVSHKHKEVMSSQDGMQIRSHAQRSRSVGAAPQKGDLQRELPNYVMESRPGIARASQRDVATRSVEESREERTPEFSTPDQGKRRMIAAKAKADERQGEIAMMAAKAKADERQLAEAAPAVGRTQTAGSSASSAWDPVSAARGVAAAVLSSAAEVTGLREHSERMKEIEALKSGFGMIPKLRPASPQVRFRPQEEAEPRTPRSKRQAQVSRSPEPKTPNSTGKSRVTDASPGAKSTEELEEMRADMATLSSAVQQMATALHAQQEAAAANALWYNMSPDGKQTEETWEEDEEEPNMLQPKRKEVPPPEPAKVTETTSKLEYVKATIVLPKLESHNTPDPSVRCGDWLHRVGLVMDTVTETSSTWWEGVLQQAHATYDSWIIADTMARMDIFVTIVPVANDKYFILASKVMAALMEIFYLKT